MTPLALPDASDAAAWTSWVSDRAATELAAAEELVERVRALPAGTAPRDVLVLWDRASGHLGNAAAMGSLIGNVHPVAEVREVADTAEADAQRLATRWSLDSGLYDVFAALTRPRSPTTRSPPGSWPRPSTTSAAPGSTGTRRPAPGSPRSGSG